MGALSRVFELAMCVESRLVTLAVWLISHRTCKERVAFGVKPALRAGTHHVTRLASTTPLAGRGVGGPVNAARGISSVNPYTSVNAV